MAHVRMENAIRSRGRGRRRELMPVLAALAICLLAAFPTLAAQGPTKLEQPVVSPTSGTTQTTITLEVTYRNHSGKAPEYVRVVIGSTAHAMTALGSDWRNGVRFRWTGKLAVGTRAVTFEARDLEKFVDSLAAGNVTIAAPPTPPPPPPPSSPAPSPTPPPSDGSGGSSGGSSSASGSGSGGEGGSSGGGATTTDPVAAVNDPEPWNVWRDASGSEDGIDDGRGKTLFSLAPAGPAGSGGSGADPDGSAGNDDGSGSSDGADGGSVDGSANGGGAGSLPAGSGGAGVFSAVNAYLQSVGADPVAALLPGGGGTTLPLVASAVGSTAAVGVWMAFSLFGKRRRDEQLPKPGEVLQAAAASGLGLVPSSGLVPEPPDPELMLPRWRRPSLLEARKHDPVREGLPERPALSFGHDVATANERRVIRYATVRLLDRPDEVMGLAVGDLAAGDEVELCERSGLFWFVRAPDGRAGWLHRMTLGDQISPGVRPSA